MSTIHSEGQEVTQTAALFDLLQENGSRILQESGFRIHIEGVFGVRVVSTPYSSPTVRTDQMSTVVSHVG